MAEITSEDRAAAALLSIDDAFDRLAMIEEGTSPVVPLLALIERRDEAVPRLLEVLALTPRDVEQRIEACEDETYGYYLHDVALLLAGYFQLADAWPLIVAYYAEESFTAIAVEMVEISTDDLPSILARCYQGHDLALLKRVVESDLEHSFARIALLQSLGGCVLLGKLPMTELESYVAALLEQALTDDGDGLFPMFLVGFAEHLGSTPETAALLNSRIAALVADGVLMEMEAPAAVKGNLESAREQFLGDKVYARFVEDIADWASFDPDGFDFPTGGDDWDEDEDEDEDDGDEDDEPKPGSPRVNYLSQPPSPFMRIGPKLGRNDPCHCGSGKKYKKCCLDKDQSELG